MMRRVDPRRSFDLHGERLDYPTRFEDGSSCMGLFTVGAARAAELLRETPFTVAEVLPGRAVCSLNCVHYTDSDCGPYDEIALALFVQPWDGTVSRLATARSIAGGDIASHTWRLAVTTELSRDAGIQMWGFPKQLGDIDYTNANGRASFSWRDGDALVLRYEVAAKGKRKPAPISPPVYSLIEGVPHVGHLTQRYEGVGVRPFGGTLELGDHTVSDELRRLGLGRRPLIATWNDRLEFEMSAPSALPERATAGI